MTQLERLEQQQLIAEMLSENDPAAYFETGSGARWMLCLAQGIQATQSFCLACEGVMAPPS